jgi:Ca-activated chloride channel family protein
VDTSYVQLARAEGDAWALRVPLTTPPRYVRSDEVTSSHARGQPLLLLRDPGHRFSLDVIVRGAGSVTSNTHELNVTENDDGMRVRLGDGEVIPDRDCVLSWRPQQKQDRPALQVLLHDDKGSGQVYFLALVAPPAAHEAGSGVPREVILLVDHSGSMRGPKWEAADWAVEKFLLDLSERDAFAVGLFHNTTRWFSKKVRQADVAAVDEAIRFLQKHKDSGGTELGVALEQALDLKPSRNDRARNVVIVTDAQVTDAGRILRLADEEAKRKQRRRISVLCIDAAPNSFLASELAERGGGVARFLTSAPEEEDITTALDQVLADWAEPVLAGLRLAVSRSEVEAAGRDVVEADKKGWSVVDLGDLPSGRAIWVAGRVPRDKSKGLSFRVTAKGKEVADLTVDLSKEARGRPALKAVFGARRILGLEFLISSGYSGEDLEDQLARLGYDPQEVLAGKAGKRRRVYAETVRADAVEALNGLLVREALDYGLACSATAFVAVRKEAGERVEGTVPVASALPAGWSGAFLSPPTGAVFKAAGGGGLLRSMAALASDTMTQFAAPSVARPAEPSLAEAKKAKPVVLFAGVPVFAEGEAVLFDTSRKQDADKLPESATIRRLVVRFPDGSPDHRSLDPELSLLIFVEDLSSARARVRLADLVRRRGERPLNLVKRPGQVVRIALLDPTGTWTRAAPKIEVALEW